jgi:serine/threonine protein kinase
MDHLPTNTELKQWKVGKLLGKGAFGHVYEVSAVGSASNDGVFAMKIVPLLGSGANKMKKLAQSRDATLLYKEYNLYMNHFKPPCPHVVTIPRNAYGENGKYRWLVMEKLDSTLNSFVKYGSKKLSWPIVSNIACQLIDTLQYIHSKRYVYVDINTENVMFKRISASSSSASSYQAFLVDFGLADTWKTVTGETKPITQDGTPMFTSKQANIISPVNDLESLGYLLLYSLEGKEALPWFQCTSNEDALRLKRTTSISDLCKHVSNKQAKAAFNEFFNLILSLSPIQPIPYDVLKKLFSPSMMKQLSFDEVSGGRVSASTPSKSVETATPLKKRGRKELTVTVTDDSPLKSPVPASTKKLVASSAKKKGVQAKQAPAPSLMKSLEAKAVAVKQTLKRSLSNQTNGYNSLSMEDGAQDDDDDDDDLSEVKVVDPVSSLASSMKKKRLIASPSPTSKSPRVSSKLKTPRVNMKMQLEDSKKPSLKNSSSSFFSFLPTFVFGSTQQEGLLSSPSSL